MNGWAGGGGGGGGLAVGAAAAVAGLPLICTHLKASSGTEVCAACKLPLRWSGELAQFHLHSGT